MSNIFSSLMLLHDKRYDRGGVERGQHDKQGRMEEEANQLYRRPQMTGQAKDEEEDCYYDTIMIIFPGT